MQKTFTALPFAIAAPSANMCLIIGAILGLAPAFPNPATVLLLLIGLFSFRFSNIKRHLLFLFLIIQYPLIQLFWNVFHTGDFGTGRLNDSYLIITVATPLILSLFVMAQDHSQKLMSGLQIGLCLTLLFLLVDYFGIHGSRTCRASAGAQNPLITSFLLCLLIPFLFNGWTYCTKTQHRIRISLFFAIFAAILFIMGARMALYAVSAILPLLLFVVFRKDQFLKNLLFVVPLALIFLLAGNALEIANGCNNLGRLSQNLDALIFFTNNSDIITAFDDGSPAGIIDDGMPRSEAYRLALWHAAWDAIQNSPWIGYGQSREYDLLNAITQTGIKHTHSQILSWLIWGGPIALVSGITFGCSILIAQGRWRIVTVASVLCAGAVLLTDSLLYWSIVFHGMIPIMTFGYVISLPHAKTAADD